MTKIIINGREIEADPSKPLIHACHSHGADVPFYCYHPGMTPKGSCRMCQVEVKQGEMPARVVAACRTSVAEGMIVDTEAPKAHQARREVLEFLLKDHPLDCPICDKAGECDLQDYAYAEGQDEHRSVEPRPGKDKRKSFGDVILYDEERCILCGRCVRFFKDVTKKAQLTIAGLAARSYISTFMGRPLAGNSQGTSADSCPGGALTLKRFRFQARVWNLDKRASTCGGCSRGCAITVEVLRGGDVKRIRARYDEAVNQWWICDHGRFSYERLNEPGRVEGGAVPGHGGFTTIDADRAIEMAADTLRVHPKPVLVASPWLTVEEGELVRELAKELGAEAGFVSPPESELADDLLHTGDPCPNRRGLADLGLEGRPAEEWIEKLAGAASAILIGERAGELLGAEALAGLPADLRLISLDTTALDVPACVLCIGVPNAAERAGTWINVDGLRRPISAAKPPPPGVAPLTRTLEGIRRAMSSAAKQQEKEVGSR